MRIWIFAAFIGSASALLVSSHPGAARHAAVARRTPLRPFMAAPTSAEEQDKVVECMLDAETEEELAACIDNGPKLFTLEEQNDGWDDVRRAVIQGKKERAGAIELIKTKYGPGFTKATKLTKVIAEEVGGIKMPEGAKIEVPSLSKEALQDSAKNALFGLLDAAAERKQKEKAAEKQKADAEAAAAAALQAKKANFFRRK